VTGARKRHNRFYAGTSLRAMRLCGSESVMRRVFITLAVSVVVLVAGALVPEGIDMRTPVAPVAAPANANLV